jgi:hypothetical protein
MQIPQYRCRWDNPLIAAEASGYEPKDRSSGDACWLAASDAGQERRLRDSDASDQRLEIYAVAFGASASGLIGRL